MKILLIGGSRFVGPVLTELLLNQGHNLTIFNRGLLKSEYPAEIHFVKGDRNKGFNLVEHFDAVIDMCSYNGAQTKNALGQLNFDFFLHFSTAAVYKKTEIFPLTEETPLGEWPVWGEYNKGKVECEKVLEEWAKSLHGRPSGIKYAAIRPVYILGPKNYLPRESFIYSKIKNGLPIILPGNGQAIIQFVFANEVAKTIVMLAEKQIAGAFNCAGDGTITLRSLVEEMAKIAGKEPDIRFNPNTDGEKFNDSEFPFTNENMICGNSKIKALGLKFRPLFSGLKDDYESYYQHVI